MYLNVTTTAVTASATATTTSKATTVATTIVPTTLNRRYNNRNKKKQQKEQQLTATTWREVLAGDFVWRRQKRFPNDSRSKWKVLAVKVKVKPIVKAFGQKLDK